jgi:sulfite oxidase
VQMREYIYYSPQIGKHNNTYSNGFSIQTMPVSSAIMTPLNHDQIIHDGKIKLTGWAFSGSGWPERVEVSGDGGNIWYEVPYDQLSKKVFYSWRVWEYEMPVDAEGWLEFCVRCWDNALNASYPPASSCGVFTMLTYPLDAANIRTERMVCTHTP